MGCVYKITDTTNGKIYVGQTNDFKDRIRHYRSDTKRFEKLGTGRRTRPIDVAMYEHDFDNFKFEILEDNLPPEELDLAEIQWIDFLNATDPNVGYNRYGGGTGKPSRAKLMAMYGKTEHFARPHTEEEKLRRSKGIVIYDTVENTINFKPSAKVLSDELGNTRSEVSKAIKRGSKLRGMYIFYIDDCDRAENFLKIYDKKMATENTQAIMSLIDYANAFEIVDNIMVKLNSMNAVRFGFEESDKLLEGT